MRVTTIVLVLVSLFSFTILLVAVIGVSVGLAVKTSLEKADWNLKGMSLYTLDYPTEDTAHVSLGIQAEVRNSNKTRTKLPFKFSGGRFTAWVNSQHIGDGTLKEKQTTLQDSFSGVELALDQNALSRSQSSGLAAFAEGKAVNLKVKLKSLRVWGIKVPVSKEFSSSVSQIEGGNNSGGGDDEGQQNNKKHRANKRVHKQTNKYAKVKMRKN